MESSISLGLAGQVALRRRLDIVANNIANADTAGFKLENQIVQTMPRRDGGDRIVYPLDRGSFTDVRPGPVTVTGNPLDVAIVGDGYLALGGAGAPRYTRDGRLTQSVDGTLTSLKGEPIRAVGGGTIQVPAETRTITISGDGTVVADAVEIGQIGLFRAPRDAGQTRRADGVLTPEAAPVPYPEGRLQQGAVEGSNVQPLHEVVDLIELHRGYQRAQDLLDGEDERIRKLVDQAVSSDR